MNIEKLTPEQVVRFKGEVISRLRKIYDERKNIFMKLKSEYNQEYSKILKENQIQKEDLKRFSDDIGEFRNLQYSINNSKASRYSSDEMRIIDHLLGYEKKLEAFVEQLKNLNHHILNAIVNLNNHANQYINIVNNLDSAHNEGEFLSRIQLLMDVKKRVVAADEDIVKRKSEIYDRKDQIERVIKKIHHRKMHLLKKLYKDLKKDEKEEKYAKQEEKKLYN